MAIAFRAKAVGSFNTGTGAVTFTDPGTAGDLLLAVFNQDNTATWTPPDGTWHSLGHTQMTFDGQSVEVWYKAQSAGGAGAIVFGGTPLGVATETYFVMLAYSGCDPTNPVNVIPAGIQDTPGPQTTTWTITSPSVTTTVGNCMLVSVVFTDQAQITTPTVTTLPSGFTQRDYPVAVDFSATGVADKAIVASGATGSAAWVLTASAGNQAEVVGYMIALAPPGGALTAWVDQGQPPLVRQRRAMPDMPQVIKAIGTPGDASYAPTLVPPIATRPRRAEQQTALPGLSALPSFPWTPPPPDAMVPPVVTRLARFDLPTVMPASIALPALPWAPPQVDQRTQPRRAQVDSPAVIATTPPPPPVAYALPSLILPQRRPATIPDAASVLRGVVMPPYTPDTPTIFRPLLRAWQWFVDAVFPSVIIPVVLPNIPGPFTIGAVASTTVIMAHDDITGISGSGDALTITESQ